MFVNEMAALAKKVLQQITRAQTTPWLRVAILGPQGAGKTTFLAVFVNKLVETLANGATWKQVFFFCLDFQAADISNPISFYKYIVKETFEQYAKQNDRMTPYKQKMITYFCGIPEGASPEQFPKRIDVDKWVHYVDIKLTRLSKIIHDLAKKGDKAKFVQFALTFPVHIGKLFRLPNVIYVVDHLEASDIDIPANGQLFNLCDQIKSVLKVYPFILCCKDDEKLVSSLRSMNKEETDLMNHVSFVNVADVKIPPEEMRNDIMVNFTGNRSIRLTREQCAGCVGFLAEWQTLVDVAEAAADFQTRQSRNNQSVSKCDEHALSIDLARKFIPKVVKTDLPMSAIREVNLIRVMS